MVRRPVNVHPRRAIKPPTRGAIDLGGSTFFFFKDSGEGDNCQQLTKIKATPRLRIFLSCFSPILVCRMSIHKRDFRYSEPRARRLLDMQLPSSGQILVLASWKTQGCRYSRGHSLPTTYLKSRKEQKVICGER